MKLLHKLLDYVTPWTLPDVYLFTGNSTVRKDGGIVMGRGAARQVRDTYPTLAYRFGKLIQQEPAERVHIIAIDWVKGQQYIGWFQVKYRWQDPADLWLIHKSTERLAQLANKHSKFTFHMNYPGVGNGQLKIKDISPIIDALPDNVWVYK